MNISQDRVRWNEVRRLEAFQGRWVALEDCERQNPADDRPECAVVDIDDSLVDLCARLREARKTNCQIVFCNMSRSESPFP